MTTRTRSLRTRLVDELLLQRHSRFVGGWHCDLGVTSWLHTEDTPAEDLADWPLAHLALREAVLPRWITVDGPYPVHAHSPSPRSRQRNALVVRGTGDDEASWWLLDRAFGQLCRLDGASQRHVPPIDDAVTVVALLDPAGLPRLYGDFGYVLSLLEAGHMAYQLLTYAAAADVSASIRFARIDAPAASQGAVALLQVRIGSVSHDDDALPTASAFSAGYGDLWIRQVSSGALRDLFAELDRPAARAADLDFHMQGTGVFTAARARRREQWAALRTSAQPHGPLSFLGDGLDAHGLRRMLTEIRDTICDLPDATLTCLLGTADESGRWWWVNPEGEAACSGPRAPDKFLSDGGHQLRGCAWIAIVMWPAPETRRGSGLDFVRGMISAGMLAQAIGVVAAEIGHAAHPMRGLAEEDLMNSFDSYFPLYLIAGGTPSLTQTRIPLE
ncbi:hypothetical protein [Microbacterium aurugineum]